MNVNAWNSGMKWIIKYGMIGTISIFLVVLALDRLSKWVI